jgi:hypothetical protein
LALPQPRCTAKPSHQRTHALCARAYTRRRTQAAPTHLPHHAPTCNHGHVSFECHVRSTAHLCTPTHFPLGAVSCAGRGLGARACGSGCGDPVGWPLARLVRARRLCVCVRGGPLSSRRALIMCVRARGGVAPRRPELLPHARHFVPAPASQPVVPMPHCPRERTGTAATVTMSLSWGGSWRCWSRRSARPR